MFNFLHAITDSILRAVSSVFISFGTMVAPVDEPQPAPAPVVAEATTTASSSNDALAASSSQKAEPLLRETPVRSGGPVVQPASVTPTAIIQKSEPVAGSPVVSPSTIQPAIAEPSNAGPTAAEQKAIAAEAERLKKVNNALSDFQRVMASQIDAYKELIAIYNRDVANVQNASGATIASVATSKQTLFNRLKTDIDALNAKTRKAITLHQGFVDQANGSPMEPVFPFYGFAMPSGPEGTYTQCFEKSEGLWFCTTQ